MASDIVERLLKKGNKRGLYDTTKLGPELVAFLDDRAGMLASLRDEMSEGYRSWLDDAVEALKTATKRTAEAAAHIESQDAALREAREAAVRLFCASGCSCCRDDEDWEKWSAELGRIFDIPAYDDGSGFNFYRARDEYKLPEEG